MDSVKRIFWSNKWFDLDETLFKLVKFDPLNTVHVAIIERGFKSYFFSKLIQNETSQFKIHE